MALVLFTQTEFETYINKKIKIDDYTRAEEYARRLIHEYCGKEFTQATYIEEEHDADTRYIQLNHFPVISISSVTTGFWDDDIQSEIIDQKYYKARSWGIEIKKAYSADFYKVTYIGGESPIPQPIKEVALGIGKDLVLEKDVPEPQVTSISSEGISYTFRTADWKEGKPTRNDEWNAILNLFATNKPSARIY